MAAGRPELLAFENRITDHFVDLCSADAGGLLSLPWLHKMLRCFMLCHEEFRALLLGRARHVARPPLDRLFADFSDRAVKALDVLNAARDGIDQLRRFQAFVEIVIAALGPASSGRMLGEGQVRRARKALTELAVMVDDRDAGHSLRNRSSAGSDSSASSIPSIGSRRLSQFRSPSSGASRSWSAARHLQAIGNNAAAFRDHEIDSTVGLVVPIYTMNAVLSFTLRSLMAAIPCHDRGGLQGHFWIPRTFLWAAPVMSLHERMVEESKKKDRKNSTGLLKEIQHIGKSTHHLMEVTEGIQYPISEEKNEELRQAVEELMQVYEIMKEGLDTLECQVREIFLRIARSHAEGHQWLSHTAQ